MTINFELLKVSKMTSLRIYISSHGETRNIKFGQQDKPHPKASIGYSNSEGTDISTSYSCDFDKSLYLYSLGLLLSNLGSKNNSLIEVHWELFHYG